MEYHHPIMSMLYFYGSRPRIRRRILFRTMAIDVDFATDNIAGF